MNGFSTLAYWNLDHRCMWLLLVKQWLFQFNGKITYSIIHLELFTFFIDTQVLLTIQSFL
jgi:hypothetical protein